MSEPTNAELIAVVKAGKEGNYGMMVVLANRLEAAEAMIKQIKGSPSWAEWEKFDETQGKLIVERDTLKAQLAERDELLREAAGFWTRCMDSDDCNICIWLDRVNKILPGKGE